MNTIDIQTVRLIASGVISGNSTLRLLGHKINNAPTLAWLSGTLANTYSGPTLCESVELWMSKLPGQNAIPGPLFLLAPVDATQSPCRAFLKLANQIADSAPITLLDGSVFDAGDANGAIGRVYLDHATLKSTNGVVTLNGNADGDGDAGVPIRGNLSLGSANRTFNVAGNYGGALEFYLTAKVSGLNGSAGIVKTGAGEMDMSGSNSYSGVTMGAAGHRACVAQQRARHGCEWNAGQRWCRSPVGEQRHRGAGRPDIEWPRRWRRVIQRGSDWFVRWVDDVDGPNRHRFTNGNSCRECELSADSVRSHQRLSHAVETRRRHVGICGAANNTHSADVIIEQGETA